MQRRLFRLPAHLAPLCLLVFLSLSAKSAQATYGWIPAYRVLVLNAGVSIQSSSDNFDTDGATAPLTVTGQAASVSDLFFWIEPEFGVAEDWSVSVRANYRSGSVSLADGTSPLSGSGLGDTWASLKYALTNTYPLFTLEGYMKTPTGVAQVAAGSGELVQGDGGVDMGMRLHMGQRTGGLVFSLSPGVVGRFNGYSSAVTVDAAVQLNFPMAWLRLFGAGFFSLGDAALPPSTLANHNIEGTAGSYTRLAGSPTSVAAGAAIGFKISKALVLSVAAEMPFYGTRAPKYFGATVGVAYSLDFFEPDVRPELKEVPFSGDDPESY